MTADPGRTPRTGSAAGPAPRRFDPGAPDAVSVIIPTHDRAGLLARAARSVLAQTHANLELIIADDASSDGTEAVVAALAAADPRVRYLRAPRRGGAAAARNLGLRAARGPLIAFQDSDDEWLLGKLEAQVAEMLANPELGATFGAKITVGTDDAGRFGEGRARVVPGAGIVAARGAEIPDRIGQDDLVRGNLISPQTMMLRAAVAGRLGGFDPRLPNNNDWEYMIRLGALAPISFTRAPVVVAHVQPDSISRGARGKALSFLVILRKHEAVFARQPAALASWYFRAGRHLEGVGRRRAAAICMARAARLAPGAPRHWAGLARARARSAMGGGRGDKRGSGHGGD